MSVLWYYTPDGRTSVYKDGGNIYAANGKCLYSATDGWWYDVNDGKALFYADDNWMYAVDGTPAFYFNK